MGWEKGQSGNPGGRPKEDAELKRLIDKNCPPEYFVKKLMDFIDFGEDHNIKLKALVILLERRYGKPHQAIEHSGEIVTWGTVIDAIRKKAAAG